MCMKTQGHKTIWPMMCRASWPKMYEFSEMDDHGPGSKPKNAQTTRKFATKGTKNRLTGLSAERGVYLRWPDDPMIRSSLLSIMY